MEQTIKILLFIKITTFILLCWICHFYSKVGTLMKSLDEKENYRRNIHARTYRLLETYGKDNNSSSLYLKEGLPINGIHKKIDTTYNEKYDSEKRKQSNVCPSRFAGGHQPGVKNKSCVFETKKYSHLEKKIFKELDYQNFLKNNRIISDKLYKKILCKKYRLRLVIPLLLLFILIISLILDYSCNSGFRRGLYKLLSLILGKAGMKDFHNFLKSTVGSFFKYTIEVTRNSQKKIAEIYRTPFLNFLIYSILFFILGIIIISGIIYYHKKVKKYEKIKFRKR
ncbi:fam-l protein [Plasmodium malariae]|uniref:Fam-l protein n=1 Tax=Plasmodium malariae TaxID=5858 RepID=A0A1D3TDQ2_PLAMA|nr:fam-l protein [Plasmodium malariae]SCP02984.1 fam-l protein [Plasmodium malariae]